MQFFSSDKEALAGNFFQNHPPPPPQELNGRPLNKFVLGPAIRTDFVSKCKTILYFLQQFFATCSNLICCKTGFEALVVKRVTPLFNTYSCNMLQNKLHVFVARLTIP